MMHRLRTAACVVLSGASLGCGEASGPTTFAIEPVVQMGEMVMRRRESDGWPEATCQVDISAIGIGPGSATWQAATFRYFQGLDRSWLDHHSDIPAADIDAEFGGPISSGDVRTAAWTVRADFPFDLEVVLRYERAGGDRDSVTTRAACGPRPTADLSSPPILSNVSLTPTGPLYRGDDIDIRFTVNGTDLWATQAAGTGSFSRVINTYADRESRVDRHHVIEVPATARTDDNFRVAIFAWDMFARFALRDVATGLIVTRPSSSADSRR